MVVLLGPNGAGKTTTLLTLSGDLPHLSGEVVFDGKPTSAPLHRRAHAGLSFVTEERSVFMRLSVAENLRVGRTRHRPGARALPRAEAPHAAARRAALRR